MNFLVTGSSGFIGRRVVDYLLAQGQGVSEFDHSGTGQDICDRDQVMEAINGTDGVIHLAGVLGTSELFDVRDKAIDVNLKGAINVLDGCAEVEATFTGITMPGAESGWANLYQATKIAAQTMATAYYRDYGVPVTHIKAFNAYGPGQAHGEGHPQKIFPTFASALWRNQEVPVWGTGEQTVDLVHVDHVAYMLATAAIESTKAYNSPGAEYVAPDFGFGQVWDAGTGLETSVLDVIYMIGEIIGVVPQIRHLPMRKGETEMTHLKATNPGPLGYDRLTITKLCEAILYYKP